MAISYEENGKTVNKVHGTRITSLFIESEELF